VEVSGGDYGVIQWEGRAKLGIPFNISFSPFTDFGFVRWRAYLNAVAPFNEVGTGYVQFSNAETRTSSVTIKQNPGVGKIILLADTESAPYIMSVSPELFRGPQQLNRRIQVIFSKPMDPASFCFEDGRLYTGDPLNFPYYSSGSEDESETRSFKGISITRNQILSTMVKDAANLFTPPYLSIDGKVLTLWVLEGFGAAAEYPGDPGGEDYRQDSTAFHINLAGVIRDTRGIPMGRSYQWSYENEPYDEQGSNIDKTEPQHVSGYNRSEVLKVIRESTAQSGGRDAIIANFFDSRSRNEPYHNATQPLGEGNHEMYALIPMEYTNSPVAGFKIAVKRGVDPYTLLEDFFLIEQDPVIKERLFDAYAHANYDNDTKAIRDSGILGLPVYVIKFNVPLPALSSSETLELRFFAVNTQDPYSMTQASGNYGYENGSPKLVGNNSLFGERAGAHATDTWNKVLIW
jgi:hypothetical protein